MPEGLKPPCELGICNYFQFDKLGEATRQYIFSECAKNLKLRMQHDPVFDEHQCPQAAFTAAVITELAVREEEIEITE